MSVTLLLTTIAAQVGSAYFNSKRSKAQSAELAEQQQRLEEKIMLQGIENSREEYVQVCALQREIEQLMQKDRLELIQQNYLDSIELDAYNVSLEHWPLFTPPYVIKGQLIDGLSGTNSTDAIPLNCIMTTSMHSKFNQKIFPQLEENLARFCSKYWNSSQPNSIRFYQNAWRDNIVDLGSRIIDLYAHLDDVPTIVISPVVRNGKITFKIHWWGISGNPKDQHTSDAMLYDPELAITITDDISLSEEQIKQIIEELSNKISALISYFADQYYGIFYGYTPVLPLLADDNDYSIKVGWKTNYSSQYKLLYEKEIEGTSTKIATNPQAVIELYSKIKPLIEDELPFPMEATNALYKSKLNIKLWYCTSLKELSLKIKSYSDSNQFYLKKVSNKIALGTYDVSDNATNIFIIICNELQKTCYDNMRVNLLSNSIENTTIDKFSKIELDNAMLQSEIAKYDELHNESIRIYEALSNMIELGEYADVIGRFKTLIEIKDWINKNRRGQNTSFELIKAYSDEIGRYMILGLFYINNEPQTSQTALISYYETLPQDIEALFRKTNRYKFTLI